MMTNFGFMTIMILMGLLMGAGHANVRPKQTNKQLHWPWALNADKGPN